MDNIKIALSGQVYNTSGLLFTFPDGLTQNPHQEWVASLQDDARNELRMLTRVGNKTKAYAIWSNNNGYYYAALTPTTSGYMMITICTGAKVVHDGVLVLDMLEQLREYFLQLEAPHQIDPTFVAGAANAIRQALIDAPKPYSNGVQDNAYRTYQNENELTDILQYAHQGEYANFKRVYIMPEEMTDTQSKYQRIVTRIKKTYQVVCPAGVTASVSDVDDGQEIIIKYHKEGYRDISKTLVAGQESELCDLQGCYINLRSAEELQLKFLRIFRFDVRNLKGEVLPVFTIGSKSFNAGKWISIPSHSVDLVVAAEGYQPLTVHVDVNQVKNEDIIPVTLSEQSAPAAPMGPEAPVAPAKPSGAEIILKIDTGKETLSAPITLSETSPLYSYLKGLNGKSLKSPEATFEKVGKKEEKKEEKKKNNVSGPIAPQFPDYSDQPEKPEPPKRAGDWKVFATVFAVLVAIILVVTGGIGYRLGWYGEKEPARLQGISTVTESDTTETVAVAEATEQKAEAEEQKAEGKYKYLDENNTWDIKEAPDQATKDIIALFQKREVSKMIESKETPLVNNTKFKEILRIISPFSAPQRQKVADIFEKNSKDNVVELSKILPEVQKLRNEDKGPSAEQQQRNAAAAEKTNVKVNAE